MKDFDLGKHTRSITTESSAAQELFNLGLNWCFGFNHEEGVACFRKALEFDPGCAMAYWGIAYGSGPFYNRPWRHLDREEADNCARVCFDAINKAISLSEACTPAEIDLIDALSKRYQKPHGVSPEAFDGWDTAYADALRNVHSKYPEDLDVMALFAEALITRTPWALWDVKRNEPAENADTMEAASICEKGIELADKLGIDQHPGVLHIHIHTFEMSPTPERSMRSADLLGALCPDAGHMNHMPGHTYVLCGRYLDAMRASEKAIAADRMFLEYAGPFNFYTTARCHDLHLMMYTCMLLGQFEPAINAAEEMCATLTEEVLSVKGRAQLAATMEGYYSMKMHVLVRFGRWTDIVDAPMPENPQLYCVSTAMHFYAKGVAYAALGNFAAADQMHTNFSESLSRVSKERKFFNNFALDVLEVAREMLTGEILYHKGDYENAFAHLRRSVHLDDNLEYSEPWAWMHPPRHALAALLSEQGHFEEAELHYRTDLGLNDDLQRCAQHPDNVWALHGLVECLRQKGDKLELPAFERKLSEALEHTDTSITSSCCCRKTIEQGVNV